MSAIDINAEIDKAMSNSVCAGERHWVEGAVNAALEVAALVCEEAVDAECYGQFGGYGLKGTRPGSECAKDIRALKIPVPEWAR